MRIKTNLPATFIVVSGSLLMLGIYLLTTKTNLHPQFFITTCGEVLRSIREHVRLNSGGVVASLILLTASISISLALWQLVKFVIAHKRLSQLNNTEQIPANLQWVINRHH